MKYRLIRKRHLAMAEIPTKSREYDQGDIFIKQGTDGDFIFMKAPDGGLVCLYRQILREDFEVYWGDTSLIGRGDGTEAD